MESFLKSFVLLVSYIIITILVLFCISCVAFKTTILIPFALLFAIPFGFVIKKIKEGQKTQHNRDDCSQRLENIANNYIYDGNITRKKDGSPITDEEVPFLIQASFQHLTQQEKAYTENTKDIYDDTIFRYDEEVFFNQLDDALVKNKLKPNLIKVQRLSDKTFNVEYIGLCHLGKINLSGKTNYMQYFRGMTPKIVHDITLEESIELIPKWISYIRYCKRNPY